ncbi:MAG: hypothetical protein QXR71_04450 [Candidatus Aenigmatarchaeota archaeon]
MEINDLVIEEIVNIDEKLPAKRKFYEIIKILKKHSNLDDLNVFYELLQNQVLTLYIEKDVYEYLLRKIDDYTYLAEQSIKLTDKQNQIREHIEKLNEMEKLNKQTT